MDAPAPAPPDAPPTAPSSRAARAGANVLMAAFSVVLTLAAVEAGAGLREAAVDGRSKPALPTPEMFAAHADKESGARNNLGYEGLSFSADGETLWVMLEAPIYEDGPAPSPDAGATTRLTRFDRQGKVLAQYAYPLDAIPARSSGRKS